MSQYETLLVDIENHIAHVRLNRPDKANAMNAAMWVELEQCFDALDQDPEVRVVVLSAEGRNFCAGLDLDVFSDIGSTENMERGRRSEHMRKLILRLQGNLNAIENCSKPVLAAIHGNCVGGGVDMIACCDMRYCCPETTFSIKEIDVGMTADVGSLQRLPHLLPQGIVRELAYTGRDVDAEEAYEVGLVNRAYEDRETMLRMVMSIAEDIASKAPLAIRGVKAQLNYARDHSVADSLDYMATWNAGMLSSDDIMTAITAKTKGKTPSYEA